MIETFEKYKKLIIVFSISFTLLMFISIFKVDYILTSPGYNNNVNQFIVVGSEYETGGSFHTTSIFSKDGITYLQFLIGSMAQKVSITPFPEYYDDLEISDLTVSSYLMKDDSLNTSLIVGIRNSGYRIDYESYLTVYLTWDHLPENTLKIGDIILDIHNIDGESIDIDDIECLDTVEFKILRRNHVLFFDITKNQISDTECVMGLSLDYYSEITYTSINYHLISSSTSGPSGGLMQSLYIFNQLTEFDYSNNLKIGGTGTISVDGSVGAIGGVEQKIYTSDINDIDIFFVPNDGRNYFDALEAYKNINSDMIIVGVDTFSDAVDYLLNYEDGEAND